MLVVCSEALNSSEQGRPDLHEVSPDDGQSSNTTLIAIVCALVLTLVRVVIAGVRDVVGCCFGNSIAISPVHVMKNREGAQVEP